VKNLYINYHPLPLLLKEGIDALDSLCPPPNKLAGRQKKGDSLPLIE